MGAPSWLHPLVTPGCALRAPSSHRPARAGAGASVEASAHWGLLATMSMAVETLGYFLGALGLLMLGVTLPHSQWRVSTIHGSVITTNTIFENLWYSCATDSLGVYNCREFPSMLALSGYLQACRALMITAILLGFLGLLFGVLGLRCTNVGSIVLSRKAKLAATAGALHILTDTSWVRPSTWAGAPRCYPSWVASVSVSTVAALQKLRRLPPGLGFPTRPPPNPPPASPPACRPLMTKWIAALGNTGKTLMCSRAGLCTGCLGQEESQDLGTSRQS